jgi:hypothetical protein
MIFFAALLAFTTMATTLYDIEQIVFDWSLFWNNNGCDVDPGLHGAFELLIDGDFCLQASSEDWLKFQCQDDDIIHLQIYNDSACTSLVDTEVWNTTADWIEGECMTSEIGGLFFEGDDVSLYNSSARVNDFTCKSTAEPHVVDVEGDVLFHFDATLHTTSNCSDDGHDINFKIHMDNPEDHCREWLGPGMGYAKIACHDSQFGVFQYWDEDSTCTSAPRFIGALNMDDFLVRDFLVEFIFDVENITLGYDVCIDSNLTLGLPLTDTTFSLMIHDMSCEGHDAVHEYISTNPQHMNEEWNIDEDDSMVFELPGSDG